MFYYTHVLYLYLFYNLPIITVNTFDRLFIIKTNIYIYIYIYISYSSFVTKLSCLLYSSRLNIFFQCSKGRTRGFVSIIIVRNQNDMKIEMQPAIAVISVSRNI